MKKSNKQIDNNCKNISVNDILTNYDKYVNEVGFDFNDDIKIKLTKYINWLSKKLNNN